MATRLPEVIIWGFAETLRRNYRVFRLGESGNRGKRDPPEVWDPEARTSADLVISELRGRLISFSFLAEAEANNNNNKNLFKNLGLCCIAT